MPSVSILIPQALKEEGILIFLSSASAAYVVSVITVTACLAVVPVCAAVAVCDTVSGRSEPDVFAVPHPVSTISNRDSESKSNAENTLFFCHNNTPLYVSVLSQYSRNSYSAFFRQFCRKSAFVIICDGAGYGKTYARFIYLVRCINAVKSVLRSVQAGLV